MISRIKRSSFIRRHGSRAMSAAAAALLLAITSCNIQNEEGHAYMNVAKDSSWDAYDTLEISWQDTADGKDGVLFRDKPGKLQSINKFLAEGYQGQRITLVYKGFLGDSLVSEVRQSFDPASPKVIERDTVLAFHPRKDEPKGTEGRPPKVTPLDLLTVVTIHDSVTFTAVATLDSSDSGPLASYAFDYDGDGASDDSSSLSKRSAALDGGHRFDLPATYTTRLRVHSATGAWTEVRGKVQVLKDEPIADAGPDQSVFAGDTVNLNGAGKDSLGHIVRKEWKIGAEAFAESSGPLTFQAPAEPGDVEAVFRVTDDDDQAGTDTVVIHVLARSQPTLTDLQVSAGKLFPRFNPADTVYADTVPYATEAITVTPAGNGTLTVKGAAVVSGEASAELRLNEAATLIPIVVSLPGVPDKTYRINVVRLPPSGDMTLSALSLPSGKLDQVFSPRKTDYTASVAHADSTLKVVATLSDTAAALTVNDIAARSGAEVAIDLIVGANTIPIVVTARDGSKNTYTLKVTRAGDGNSDLAGLSVSAGSVAETLGPDAVFMTLSVPNNVDSARLTAKPVRETSTMTVNKQALKAEAPLSIPLAVGDNTLTLVVTAQSGDKKTYTVFITRAKNDDADLAALALTAGEIAPAFTPGVVDYSLSVGSGVLSTRVSARASAKTSSLQVNGAALASGDTSAAIALKVGDTPISIQVTAESKTTRTYTVMVSRAADANAALSNLSVSAGPLDKKFDPAVLAYSVAAPNESTTVTITPTAAAATSTIKVNSNSVVSGKPSPVMNLGLNANAFQIVVTAQNNATRIYTVTVNRALNGNGNLAKVVLSAGTPVFASDSLIYRLTVANSVTSTTVTPTVAVGTSTVKVNGTSVTSGSASAPIALALGLNIIPIQVTSENGAVKTFKVNVFREFQPQVSGGNGFSHFIKADGTLWGTGSNSFGQLGDGTSVDKSTPVQIMKGSTFLQVSSGLHFTLMLRSDSTLWAAGENPYGQFGSATPASALLPVHIMTGSTFINIAAGGYHSLFLKRDSTLWSAGYNHVGELGVGNTVNSSTPVQIMKGSFFRAIAAGSYHSVMIKSDGTLWVTGYNDKGQTGRGSVKYDSVPVHLSTKPHFRRIAAGGSCTLMIDADDFLWATGENTDGQLGDGTKVNKTLPVQIMAGSTFAQVAAYGRHSLMLKINGNVYGSLWATGNNAEGELGDGTTTSRSSPVQIMVDPISQISAGASHSLILKSDGTFWAMGMNSQGALGDGTLVNKSTPVQILPR